MAIGENDSVLGLKIAALFLIPAFCYLGASPSHLIRNMAANKMLLSWCNVVSGAIILGKLLLSLTPTPE